MMSDDQSMRDRALTEASDDDWSRAGTSARAGPARSGSLAAASAAGDAASAPPADADATSASVGEAGAAGPRKKAAAGKNRSFWRELPVLIVIALVIALLVKSFVVQAFYIPSSSMEDTLEIGDKVLVNKVVYHFRAIAPGDIVVFNGAGSWNPVPAPVRPSSDPIVRLYDSAVKPLLHSIAGLSGTAPGQTDYIKRVIGVPGDHVACCNADGLVTVNGVALHEKSYLYPGNAPSDIHFHITVPPGRLWVMGDHRFVSFDSRLHTADPGSGTIPEDRVIGRAFLIVWPPSRWRALPIPSTFSQRGIGASAALSGAGKSGAAGSAASAAALSRGVPVAPSSPYLPLAAGFAGAVPLTWLQRRAWLVARRRRLLRRR